MWRASSILVSLAVVISAACGSDADPPAEMEAPTVEPEPSEPAPVVDSPGQVEDDPWAGTVLVPEDLVDRASEEITSDEYRSALDELERELDADPISELEEEQSP